MSHDYDERKVVLHVHQMHDATTDTDHPAVECVSTHDTTPLWVASVMYLILDRYLSSIDESQQNAFLKRVLKIFHYLVRDQQGSAFINTVYVDPEDPEEE